MHVERPLANPTPTCHTLPMLKVHYFNIEPGDDRDTACGKTPGSPEAAKLHRCFVQEVTDKINETTCTTCLKRLYEGAIWAMHHHEQEAVDAEDRACAVSEQ